MRTVPSNSAPAAHPGQPVEPLVELLDVEAVHHLLDLRAHRDRQHRRVRVDRLGQQGGALLADLGVEAGGDVLVGSSQGNFHINLKFPVGQGPQS